METICVYKYNTNQSCNDKSIKTAGQQKRTAKNKYNKQSKQNIG